MAIRVTTDIPFGNAADIHIGENNGVPEISFTSHPHGGTESLWFCFRANSEGAPPSRLRITLTNPDTLLGVGHGDHVYPVVKRNADSSDTDWERLSAGTVQELPDGRWNVYWDIEKPGSSVDVAVCYPYGPDELSTLLADTNKAFSVDTIGVTQHGRPMLRLSNDPGSAGGDRAGVFLMARQHSGETTGSWVLDGILREFARHGGKAPLAWVVPFTNLDGVIEGDYGKDPFPWDLNRAWSSPAMRHEILVIQRDADRWRKRCRPVFALDLHAPGANENAGVYAFQPDPGRATGAWQRSNQWATALRDGIGEYAWSEFDRVVHYGSRWQGSQTMQRWFEERGITALGIETPYGSIGETVLTRESYREIGARMARVIIERCGRIS